MMLLAAWISSVARLVLTVRSMMMLPLRAALKMMLPCAPPSAPALVVVSTTLVCASSAALSVPSVTFAKDELETGWNGDAPVRATLAPLLPRRTLMSPGSNSQVPGRPSVLLAVTRDPPTSR